MATTFKLNKGTDIVVREADGKTRFSKMTRDHVADPATVTANDDGFWFDFGTKQVYALADVVVVEGEGAAIKGGDAICPRHGGPLDNGKRCWECDVEEDVAMAEREETRQVAQYKMDRDAQQHERFPGPTAQVKDGTYTVVFNGNEAEYVTIRFDTSTNKVKGDGTPNTWYGKQFVQYLSGPDNGSDFQSFGTWEQGDVRVWRKHQNSVAIAKYVKAALVVAASDDPGQYGQAYAMRSGRCCNCGRKLTVPASLHRGMGPVCAEGGRDA